MKRKRARWLVVSMLLLLALWGFVIEPRRLVVHAQAIALADWPIDMRDLRIVAMSDLHIGGPHMSLDRLRDVVGRANALQPDVIVLLGDFLADAPSDADPVIERAAPILAELHASMGVYAVLGNHDWWYGVESVRHALARANIDLLDEKSAPLQRGRARVWLVGIPDYTTRSPRPSRVLDALQVPEGEPIVCLTHDPSVFPDMPARVSLTLAGHTHGGQVRLPWIGAPIVPSRFGQRYVAGLVEESGHQLFVTTGVGTSLLPVRFGVPPELALLTLRGLR